ncbi:MAG: Crp/Fnr family transcriptional regulator [Ignavibacteria bacterium]|nr:Crp/Fnr family transcriptional regulator [Ignavibacteria bacterium]
MLDNLYILYKNLQPKPYLAGEIIYTEDTPVDKVFLIKSGYVKIYHSGSPNKIIFQFCGDGEIPGLKDIFRGKNYTNTAEAAKDTLLYVIQYNEFKKVLKTDPELRIEIMKTLCGGIGTLEDKISSVKGSRGEDRLIEALNILIQEFGILPGGTINIKLTLEDIAALTCLSKSYTKKVISEFSTRGIISYTANHIKILDRKRVEKSNIKY